MLTTQELIDHRQNMVKHFIALRMVDPDYARYALKAYADMPDCPNPDIAEAVREAWKDAQPKKENHDGSH